MTGSARRAIPATCATHGGASGYTNLLVTKRDGTIQLDPHVDGSCLITLDEAGASTLLETLQNWLG
jgi:hypothetical protein